MGDLLFQEAEDLLADQLCGDETLLLVSQLILWVVARPQGQPGDNLFEKLLAVIARQSADAHHLVKVPQGFVGSLVRFELIP